MKDVKSWDKVEMFPGSRFQVLIFLKVETRWNDHVEGRLKKLTNNQVCLLWD